MNCYKKLLATALFSSVIYASGASASIWQKNMTFDNDASSWGVYTHLDGGGYVSSSSSNARSGTKSGLVYSITGWSGIGRNITVSAFSSRNYSQCAGGIYAKGGKSYFEVIDTATWTYLRPLAHTSGSSSYKKLTSGTWAPKKEVYFRYVANAGTAGGFTYSYVDDAVMQCAY